MNSNLINTTVQPFTATAFCNGDEIIVRNQDLLGNWSIFFFYPADFTFVCPTELSELADYYQKFKNLGAEIYSISTDTHYTHKAWHDSSETIKKIKFPMIADPSGIISRNFGVYVEEDGVALRGTFIIDPQGIIKTYEINDLGIGRSSDELLRKLNAVQFVAENGNEVCPAAWRPGEKTISPSLGLVGKL